MWIYWTWMEFEWTELSLLVSLIFQRIFFSFPRLEQHSWNSSFSHIHIHHSDFFDDWQKVIENLSSLNKTLISKFVKSFLILIFHLSSWQPTSASRFHMVTHPTWKLLNKITNIELSFFPWQEITNWNKIISFFFLLVYL